MSNSSPSVGFHTNPERINRNGAPRKEWTWRGILLQAAEIAAEDGREVKEVVAEALMLKAMAGDVPAIKEFGDRIDGKAKQDIGLGGMNGEPINIKVTYE